MHGKQKGYKKLLVNNGSMPGVDKISTSDEYKNAMEGGIDLNQMMVKLCELNECACEDIILSINTSSSVEKVAYR